MKLSSIIYTLLISTAYISSSCTAHKTEETVCVAFYNLENLFDTIDDTLIQDNEFLPQAAKQWTAERYQEKLRNMSVAIDSIGGKEVVVGPDLLGVCEVENKKVLQDLIQTKRLKKMNFGIVHYDSPDKRGIDVGLLFNKKSFTLQNSKAYQLSIPDRNDFFSRDQLLVSGLLLNEKTHIIVNHWPSRYGGEEKSRPFRIAAATLTRHIVDSLQNLEDGSKIIVMGDFNDDPHNESVKQYLNTGGDKQTTTNPQLYNPMVKMHDPDHYGSLIYRGKWNLFDQIIISPEYLNTGNKGLKFKYAKIVDNNFLRVAEGKYKGYTKRTYVGNHYHGGYSDHFPVYVILHK